MDLNTVIEMAKRDGFAVRYLDNGNCHIQLSRTIVPFSYDKKTQKLFREIRFRVHGYSVELRDGTNIELFKKSAKWLAIVIVRNTDRNPIYDTICVAATDVWSDYSIKGWTIYLMKLCDTYTEAKRACIEWKSKKHS